MVSHDGKMRIDLHALHVDEAKSMLTEYIFPALPVVKRVIVITGRGANSKGGKAVLKDEIKVSVGSYSTRSFYEQATTFVKISLVTRER
jgi:DNA-nicking Smr family endonuclease